MKEKKNLIFCNINIIRWAHAIMLANMRIYVYAGYPPKKRRILHGIKLLNARNKILELKKFSLFFLHH